MDIRIKRLPNESRFLLLSYSELSFSRHYSFIDSQESWIYLQLVETWNWLISNCLTICIHLYTKQDKFDLSTQLKMLDTCQDRNFYFKKEFRETRIDLHEQLFLTERFFVVVVVVIMTYERDQNTLQKIVLGLILYVFNNGGTNDWLS